MTPAGSACRRLLAAGSAAVVAAGAALAASRAVPSPALRLKAIYGRYISFAPFAIAREEGLFRAQGLEVEFVHATSTSDAMPALIRGEIDVGGGLIKVADFNTIARGANLRIVADMGHNEAEPCVSVALMARPAFLAAKSPESAEHLKGARVSALPLSFGEYVLETFVNSKGLRLSDLNLVRLQAATAVEALSEGSLDFTYLSEPFVSLAARKGRAVVWKPLHRIVPQAQLAVLLFGPSLLTRNREAGLRFMTAYLQAVRQYNLGKTDRNVEILSRETGYEPGQLRQACWTWIHADGRLNLESLAAFQRWAVRRGVQDAELPPSAFWDASFAEEANRVLGPPAS